MTFTRLPRKEEQSPKGFKDPLEPTKYTLYTSYIYMAAKWNNSSACLHDF